MKKNVLIIWSLISLTVFSPPLQAKKAALFMDWHSHARGQELFQQEGSQLWNLRKAIQDRGWDIESFNPDTKEGDLWIFWNLGPATRRIDFSQRGPERRVLFLFEPPTVQPELYDPQLQAQFDRIYTWEDDRVDGVRVFKFYYPVLRPRILERPPFRDKKLCTLIATRLCSKHPKELYSEREKTIRFFEAYENEFDLYGRGWEKRKFKNWKGPIPDKLAVLQRYRFCICYENMRDVQGYVTEKIFDCFAAGVVPIYWGAQNIGDFVPTDCFLDRRNFHDLPSLRRRMVEMREEEYEGYVERAAQFLNSAAAKRFSEEAFLETCLENFQSPQEESDGCSCGS